LLVNKYPAKFIAFDLVKKGSYIERLKELNLINPTKHIQIIESNLDLINLWEKAKREKWEGIVIKNPSASYEMRRSWNFLKIKCEKYKDIDFVSYEVNNAGIRCKM